VATYRGIKFRSILLELTARCVYIIERRMAINEGRIHVKVVGENLGH
jgi:hypothetical protein